jgi:flagellar biosynthesis component FlhA
MQQYTVPQFIDVENKIIGPITVRQFMIFLAAAIIIGLSYRLFDFSLFLTIAVVVFLIAVTFAFVKVNSQSFHLFLLNAVQTLRRPRIRVWNNRLVTTEPEESAPAITSAAHPAPPKLYKESRLAELALIVDTKGRYKGE